MFAHPEELLDPDKYTFKRVVTLATMAAGYASIATKNYKNHCYLVAAMGGTILSFDQFIAAYDHLSVATALQWGGASSAATAFTANRALKIRHASKTA